MVPVSILLHRVLNTYAIRNIGQMNGYAWVIGDFTVKGIMMSNNFVCNPHTQDLSHSQASNERENKQIVEIIRKWSALNR